jgi:O-antigen ligase
LVLSSHTTIGSYTPTVEGSRVRAVATPAGRIGIIGPVVLQTILVTGLPALFLARGQAGMAGRSLWLALAIVLARLAVVGRRDELLCVALAVTPFMNLLRGSLFFHVVPALLGGAVFYWFARRRGALTAFVGTNKLVAWLAGYFFVYYLLSVTSTHRYEVNLRMTECLLGAVIVLVLGRRHELLSAALAGVALSACLVGAAMLPHLGANDRLGMLQLDGLKLGNPAQLGLPLALSVLVLLMDQGYWMGLVKHRYFRIVTSLAPLTLLLLTTSRAAWLVVAIGVGCQFTFGRQARAFVLVAIALGFAILRAVLASSAGGELQAGLERTFSSERSARNRTSGRSDQWIVAYNAFTESAGALLWGHGAGSGPRVYARKSLETPNVEFEVGNEMALHSWYMQIGVELGLAGLVPFAVWLLVAGRRVASSSARTGYLLPMAGLLGYVAIAATVSGNDTSSGVFLGLGLMGAAYTQGVGRRHSVGRMEVARGQVAVVPRGSAGAL